MRTRRNQALSGVAIAIACLILAAVTPAAAHPPNSLGIWFDPAYTQQDNQGDAFPFMGEAYLVLHELSFSGLGGWECRIATDGPVTLLGWNLEGVAINFENPPSFTVGMGEPLPDSDAILLATVQYMVTAAGPITFSIRPTVHASIPGSMACITFADPNIMLPLITVTGAPEVAWINRDVPICTVTPEAVDFGVQAVGTEVRRNVTVANDGGGLITVRPTLAGDCGTFRIISGGGTYSLGQGQQRTIVVGFLPTDIDVFACALDLGTSCPPIPLTGAGREPVLAGHVGPNPLLFGGVTATLSFDRTVGVVNTGDIPLVVQVRPEPGCTAFTVVSAVDFTVPAGTLVPLTVRFTPPAPGEYACELALHDVIAPLVITGTGLAPAVGWTVAPTALDFGAVGVGSAPVQRTVTVRNTGQLPTALDLALVDASGVFSIVAPADLRPVVNPNTNLTVAIAFSPFVGGYHGGTLVLGGGAPDVPLAGVAQEPVPACDVTTDLVDFGRVPILGQSSRSFRVNNTGNTVLALAPALTCPEFSVPTFPATIAPGGFGWITVAYYPTDLGIDLCVLDLGPDACSSVNLLGEGVTGGGTVGEDEVGISFSTDFYEPIGYAPTFSPIRAYLVMSGTSFGNGVWAWELKISHEPQLILLSTYLRGQAINFLTPPDFVVGLAAPLPEAPLIVLAELEFMPLDLYPHWLQLGPSSIPSIPGQMVWAYNDQYELTVMTPLGGEPIVAWINPDGPLAVQAPTPLLSLAGGRVELRWPLPGDGSDGCHVYRAIGGSETRLTSSLLQPTGQGFVYVDDLDGLAGGVTAAYSYAIVQGGTEIARSPAAAVELPAAALLATGLQPNRPNPFNPETEIHFTLAAAGSVRLSVFDVTGRRIAVLSDGVRGEGLHHVTWQGRDDAGRAVPSGSYYVRLETAAGSDTRKVMLLK